MQRMDVPLYFQFQLVRDLNIATLHHSWEGYKQLQYLTNKISIYFIIEYVKTKQLMF